MIKNAIKTKNNNTNNKNNKNKQPKVVVRKYTGNPFPFNPRMRALASQNVTNLRKIPLDTIKETMESYSKYQAAQYVVGLIHPDLAVSNQIPLKLYSEIPVPTASIGYHEQLQFTTSSVGTFLLTWRPSLLTTQGFLTANNATATSQLTYNNSSNLNGSTAISGNAYVAKTYYPNVALQRYRLVSAMIKVSYNGSVLNQSGTLVSCATFDPFKVAYGWSGAPVTTLSDSLADRFGVFSLITNGLWNTTVDVTKNSEGLECLYVPMDPNDKMFEFIDTYYGTTLSGPGTYSPDAEGAHINYVIAGKNLPASSSCIIVDIYYNYEVIADPSAAPILRSSCSSLDKKASDKVDNSVRAVIQNGALIKPTKTFSWKTALNEALKLGIKYIPSILGAV